MQLSSSRDCTRGVTTSCDEPGVASLVFRLRILWRAASKKSSTLDGMSIRIASTPSCEQIEDMTSKVPLLAASARTLMHP